MMRRKGSAEELERRRYRAIQLLEDGYDAGEVARRVGVDRRSVRRWKAAHREGGDRALTARPASGRPHKLTPIQREALEAALLEGAQAAGFATDLWTCPRVRDLIWKRFGVRYHVDHIGRLLGTLGWSPQRPQRRAVERDEEKIQGWVKKSWPRIKKKPRD